MQQTGAVFVAELDRPSVDDPASEGVECQDRDIAGPIANLAGHFAAQSTSGLGGKADDQDAGSIETAVINAVINKLSNPPGESGRLATAWPGNDGQQSIGRSDGLQLRRRKVASCHSCLPAWPLVFRPAIVRTGRAWFRGEARAT
jgi:hypothetical protein